LWTLWRIWKSRNLLVYQQRSCEWRKEAQQAVTDAYEWADQGTTANLTTNRSTYDPNCGWTKPDAGYIKCNYDCSYSQNGNIVKAGWILRDCNGYYKEASQSTGHNCVNTLEAELQALLMAMQHVWGKGYTHVIFEGDNQQAVSLSTGKSRNFQVHNLIREIQVWEKRFTRATIKWTPRTSNKAADCLAKAPIPLNSAFVNHFYVPRFLVQILHEDHISSY